MIDRQTSRMTDIPTNQKQWGVESLGRDQRISKMTISVAFSYLCHTFHRLFDLGFPHLAFLCFEFSISLFRSSLFLIFLLDFVSGKNSFIFIHSSIHQRLFSSIHHSIDRLFINSFFRSKAFFINSFFRSKAFFINSLFRSKAFFINSLFH